MEPTAFVLVQFWPWISKTALATLQAATADWLSTNLADDARRVQVRLRLAPSLDERARRLAWVTYVQLVTRISIVALPNAHGFDREALSSLHGLFQRLRIALEEAGPSSAAQGDRTGTPIGVVVAVILNVVLRPFLAHWHPRLEVYESGRAAAASQWSHEQEWGDHAEFRRQLSLLQEGLLGFASALESILEIPPLASLRETGAIPESRGGGDG